MFGIEMPKINWLLAVWSFVKGMLFGILIYIPTLNGDVAFGLGMLFAYLEYLRKLPEPRQKI